MIDIFFKNELKKIILCEVTHFMRGYTFR